MRACPRRCATSALARALPCLYRVPAPLVARWRRVVPDPRSVLAQDPFADMRPYHDHENWITKWIRSKMVTPEDREKKLAAILGKMKNGADELCAPPPPSPAVAGLRTRSHEPFRCARGCARGHVVLSMGLHELPGAARCCFVRLSFPYPLASEARQRRSLTAGAGGCAKTELCLGGQLEAGLEPMQGRELHTVPHWHRAAERASAVRGRPPLVPRTCGERVEGRLTDSSAQCRKEKYSQPTKAPLFFRAAGNTTFEQPHFISGRQQDQLKPRTHGCF